MDTQAAHTTSRRAYKFLAKGGERVKKFAIRQVETVKTTAAFYECKICLPLCGIWLPSD